MALMAKVEKIEDNKMYVKLKNKPIPKESPIPPFFFSQERETPMKVNIKAANAENNHEMNPDALYVAEISANKGPTMKRFMPGSQGRASIILKRTSHVGVTLKVR